MNCLSDSICNASAVLDWVHSAAATIDYVGMVVFGGQWQAIGPDVASHADALHAYFPTLFGEPAGGCQRYASLGGFNG